MTKKKNHYYFANRLTNNFVNQRCNKQLTLKILKIIENNLLTMNHNTFLNNQTT